MSKIVITIEDLPGDRVKASMTPSFSELAFKVKNSISPLTSAETYAVSVVNRIMEINNSKKKEPTRIIIPKLRGY